MNSISALLKSANTRLASYFDSARPDAELLLCYVLEKPKSYLYTWPEKTLNTEQIALFEALLQRRLHGEPVAYLIGEKEFWSLNFKVAPDVLIPRADTEVLIETALSLLPKTECKIADLGTGSGAIAIALAYERPVWKIWATDQSRAALEIAKLNAARHKVSIEFAQGDWLAALPEIKFDAILSNPPYIDEKDPHLLTEIRFEPKSALVADNKGLNDLETIIYNAKAYLKPGAWLLLEHGFNQAPPVADLFKQAGYQAISHRTDINGHQRITLGQLLN